MLVTVGEVKSAAKKAWPLASQFSVQLADTTPGSNERYLVSAIGEHNLLLGRMSAKSLNDLKRRLETEIK
jgi:hypothetical protein